MSMSKIMSMRMVLGKSDTELIFIPEAQSRISPYHSHTQLLIQATQAGRWLIFCQPVVHRLLSYGNENDNGYDIHLRS